MDEAIGYTTRAVEKLISVIRYDFDAAVPGPN
jgi:hypothetical protein